jgi:hypothetical protein
MSHARPVLRETFAAALPLAGLLLALAGCGRTSVTINPAGAAAADEQSRPAAKEAPREGTKGEAAGDGFHFADDSGGELEGKLLAPPVRPAPGEDRTGPHRFARSSAVESPRLPLPPTRLEPVRLPAPKASGLTRPGPLPEGIPLVSYYGTPEPPEAPRLAAGEPVREPSADVNRPLPLPLLGQETPDRVPLDDPTAEASLAAALAAPLPQRTTPAPFLRLGVPDPFENRRTVRLPAPVEEPAAPVAASPRTPPAGK